MENPKLALIPSGYKSGKVYSILPVNGVGDFAFSRNTESSRVNKEGLIETVGNNVPRLDWLNSDCPSLLLEPQRTNLVQYSEDFNSWGDSGITVTSNALISPSGGLTADKLQSTANNWRKSDTYTATNGAEYSVSIYAKLDTSTSTTTARISIYRGVNSIASNFNLSTGAISGSISNTFIENIGNDWYRIGGTYVSDGTTNIFYIYPSSGYSISGTMFFWGAQVEQGSYPTSYIKTTGSAVTRLIDNSHLLNQTLFTDYPFTVYAKAKIDAVGNTVFGLNNTSSNQYYLLFYFPNSSQVSVGRATTGFNDFDNYNFSYSVGDTIKVIIAFISEIEYKLYINGNEIAHVTNGTSIPFNHDDISLGQLRITGDTGTRNSINEFRIYDRVLTEAEAIKLTK